MPRLRSSAGIAAATLFILLGALVIPYAGIQADEALFSEPLFRHMDKDLRLPFLPEHVPLMVMTYVGSLKTVVYWPILRIFGSSPWTVRFPTVLMGAATIFIFFYLARSAVGEPVAIMGAFLLATDPVFLMTNTFDWGPVALEHLFLVTGCWFVYRFGFQIAPDVGSNAPIWNLAAGFFCWGLALWNKAVFGWALSALVVGGVLVFWPEIKRRLTPRVVLVAAGAFLCGALPLVIYNLTHASATLSENAHLDPSSVAGKWIHLENALNGGSLFGYMVGPDWWPNPKAPQSQPGQAAAWIREHLGDHERTGFYYAVGALLLAAPWWWKSRAARFSLVFMIVAWLMMALTVNAGTGAHHVVLMWPFPMLFAAVALASLPWRPIAWVATTVMVAMNLLVLNQYIAQFERNGANTVYSDAIYPLSASLNEHADRTLYIIDWGLYENLNLMHQGRLAFRIAQGPLTTDSPSPAQLDVVQTMLRDPTGLILDHVRDREVFPDVGARLERIAQSFGYRREVVRTIPDSNGRPIFEILRFVARP